MTTISDLVGKTLKTVRHNVDANVLEFVTKEDQTFRMHHIQDCCEHVYVESIVGELKDLVDTPILVAEERTEIGEETEDLESSTWTFYTIRTIKGTVDIRWCGTSNGYYSESVDFECV